MDRRTFIELTVAAGCASSVGNALSHGRHLFSAGAVGSGHLIPEWIAATPATLYRPYVSRSGKAADTISWIQIDLGSPQRIDAIRLVPAGGHEMWPFPLGFGSFPVRYKLGLASTADFQNERLISNCTAADVTDPKDQVLDYHVGGRIARYVRLTVTRMASKPKSSEFAFALSRISVLSQGSDVALSCIATADPIYGNPDDLMQITRPLRPMGEGIITDNPSNVISEGKLQRVPYRAQVPLNGVTLNGGLFQTVMERNIEYLLTSYSVPELLRQFRARAGKPNPPGLPTPDPFWEEDLAGSNAGRFLMGAGNTVRWMDHPELHRRLNEVVDGIKECRQPNGYIMAYPEDTIFHSERGAYTRAWVTHGLIEAGYSGKSEAFDLLRGYYDWFDDCPYLPQLLRRAGLGPQGMIANTRMYFTPVGKSKDIQVIMRYFQENYWLDQLARRDDQAIWQYPYDRPHCYEITFLEAYLDLYRATGETRYLNAMLGAWQLYHRNWEHIGGSMSMEEFVEDPPGSFRIDHSHGELCGTVFWTFFNQRLHLLYPEEEKYVAEIEKSIYNVAIANQDQGRGIRYFAVLTGPKQASTHMNTCCEGQGTRLLGSLPEHIYSLAEDGIYINLFAPSTLVWEGKSTKLKLTMETSFPFERKVVIHIAAPRPTHAKIRVRVPGWCSESVALMINGELALTGDPGTYVTFDRTWSEAETISFELPAKLRLVPYKGSQVLGEDRYSIEYGPILLAAVGANDFAFKMPGESAESLLDQLTAVADKPLHFAMNNNSGVVYMPYWQVSNQPFTCLPRVQTVASVEHA
jgi:uncharacterized protein